MDIFINGSRAMVSTAAVGFVLCPFMGDGATIYKFFGGKNEVRYRSNFREMMSKFRVLKKWCYRKIVL